jgi:hypothetical protein
VRSFFAEFRQARVMLMAIGCLACLIRIGQVLVSFYFTGGVQ